jgi:hypothetical protein
MDAESSNLSPSASDVIAALSRTGFILEYRVAQKLRRAGFETSINHAYPDPENGKSREIDVLATIEKEIRRQPVDINVYMDLVIECKNSLNPFVLIGERGQDRIYPDESVILSFDPFRLGFPEKKYRRVFHELKLASLPGSRRREDFMGHQLVRMNRQNGSWKADNTSIYDSILYPLAKAWQFRIKEHIPDDAEAKKFNIEQWDFPYLSYTLPVIVTAGPVLAVDASSDEPVVDEVAWTSLKREFRSSDLSIVLRADILQFEHFDQFLESRALSIFRAAEETLRTNIHLWDPEWLITNLGNPERSEAFNIWIGQVRGKRNAK